ncbi:AAA family ATPase [Alkalicoccus luteus]|uniref:AAA family ATPase n=1 Tax=Alkalicoccus luteus TaxID=1237094 RepID=A0A969PS96_9BACI|nr:AAA family ATPase [Alkalicoccus luteus]NJP36604.1 AAA family ATPase [Alkalicoccus luteus]
MNLTRIYIRSYYKWKDQLWELDKRTMFSGKNEAGKSTILSFIEGVLFGFNDQEMTGACGSLLFEGNENSWMIERDQKRTIRGECTVYRNGVLYNEELLPDLSFHMFRSLYRLDLEQLQAMQKKDSQEVGSLLYDTSFSGLKRLMEEDKKRSKERLKLFKPRGRKTELNEAAAKLDQLQQQIRKAEQELDTYERLKEESALLEQERTSIALRRRSLESTRRDYEALEKLQPIKDSWLHWKAKAKESPLLPSETVHHYREMKQLHAELQEEKRTLQRDRRQPVPFEKEAELARLRTLMRTFPERAVWENQLEEAGASLEQLQQEQLALERENPADAHLQQLPAADVLAERTASPVKGPSQIVWWVTTAALLIIAATGFAAAELVTAFMALIAAVVSAAGTLIVKNKNIEIADSAYSHLSASEKEKLLSLKQRYDKAADAIVSVEKEYRIAASKLDALMESAVSFAEDAASPAEMEGMLQLKLERLERSSLSSEEEERRFQHQQAKLEAVESRMAALEADMAGLREQSGEVDDSVFEELLMRVEAGQTAAEEADRCYRRMLDLIPEEEELLKLLQKTHDEEEYESLMRSLNELETEAVQNERKSAETTLLIKQLEEQGSYEALTQQYHEGQEALIAAAKKWAVLEASGAAVEKLVKKYEEEKLPAVMKRTSDLFRRMTNGRYVAVSMPDNGTFSAETYSGAIFSPDQLSRGTRELLYTALRLSLTAERETFPLIMDEPVVNMDKERRSAFFKEAAAHPSQLIFFTCHRHIEQEWLQTAGGRVHVLER